MVASRFIGCVSLVSCPADSIASIQLVGAAYRLNERVAAIRISSQLAFLRVLQISKGIVAVIDEKVLPAPTAIYIDELSAVGRVL